MSGDLQDTIRIFPRPSTEKGHAEVYERLAEYFPRALSYSSDALAAFAGVLNAFNDDPGHRKYMKHFYGVPLFYDLNATYSPIPPAGSCIRGLAWYLAAPIPCI